MQEDGNRQASRTGALKIQAQHAIMYHYSVARILK